MPSRTASESVTSASESGSNSEGSETSRSQSPPSPTTTSKRKNSSRTSEGPRKRQKTTSPVEASGNSAKVVESPHTSEPSKPSRPSRSSSPKGGRSTSVGRSGVDNSSGRGEDSENQQTSSSDEEGSSSESIGSDDNRRAQIGQGPVGDRQTSKKGDEHVHGSRDAATGSTTAGEASSGDKHAPSPPLARAYEPPPGFAKIVRGTGKDASINRMLNPESLEGRELWYITVPASVPLTSVSFLETDPSKPGALSMSHRGDTYVLQAQEHEEPRLLTSEDGGSSYKPTQAAFTNICSIKRAAGRPSELQAYGQSKGGSQAAAITSVPPVKKAPQQPKGLKTKHWATGFEELEKASDVRSPAAPPSFKVPNDVAAPSKSGSSKSRETSKASKRKSQQFEVSGSEESSDSGETARHVKQPKTPNAKAVKAPSREERARDVLKRHAVDPKVKTKQKQPSASSSASSSKANDSDSSKSGSSTTPTEASRQHAQTKPQPKSAKERAASPPDC